MEDYLGKAKELLSTEVPTLRDCLRLACLIQKKHLLELDRGKTKPIKDVLAEVVSRVYDQWKLSNILFVPPVTILPWSLQKKLQSAWDNISYMLGQACKHKHSLGIRQSRVSRICYIGREFWISWWTLSSASAPLPFVLFPAKRTALVLMPSAAVLSCPKYLFWNCPGSMPKGKSCRRGPAMP